MLVLTADVKEKNICDWQDVCLVGADIVDGAVPLVVLDAVIVDVDEGGPLEAALHSVQLVAGVGGEAGAVGLAVEAVVGHALTGSVRIHLQELELAEVSLVEELLVLVDVIHEVLTSTGIRCPPLVGEEGWAGSDAGLHGLHTTVNQDGIHCRALVRIDPVFAALEVGVGCLDVLA